jgi:CHAT domain-containing protein
MESFYTNLETAGSVEEALSLAQRALMADEKTRHPFYWAAFVPVRGPQ